MTHVMRKYGKPLMAVLTVGLMLTWGISSSLNKPVDSGAIQKGTIGGKKMLARDLGMANSDILILKRFLVGLPFGGDQIPVSLMEALVTGRMVEHPAFGRFWIIPPRVPLSTDENEQVVHWYLLLKESQNYGIYPGDGDVTAVVQQLGLTEDAMRKHLTEIGTTQKGLREAIRHALMLRRLSELAATATEVSLPQVELDADRTMSRADITLASIDGAKDWEKSPEPSADQIKKQFETYKDRTPGLTAAGPQKTPDGHSFLFGYKYPDRVKVEWLRFERGEIGKQFKPTSEDYDAAYKYYRDHPTDPLFRRDVGPSATQAVGPTSQPAASQPGIKTFPEVQEQLVKNEINNRVTKLMKKAVDQALRIAAEPWKNAPIDQGYKKPIPENQWIPYPKIADELARNKEYGGYKPAYRAETGFLGAMELHNLAGIGTASFQATKGPVPFPALALHVHELAGPKDPLAFLFMEVGLEGQVLQDELGDMYIYRVTAADKSHEPATLDEVQPQVVQDLKKLGAFERAKEQAKQLANQARAGGLKELAKSMKLEAAEVREITQDPTQDTQDIRQLRAVPGLLDAIVALTQEPAATQPVQNAKRVSPTTTFPRDDALRVYIIELVNFRPVSPAEFAAERWKQVSKSDQNERAAFANDWLSMSAISERLHFIPSEPLKKKENPEDE